MQRVGMLSAIYASGFAVGGIRRVPLPRSKLTPAAHDTHHALDDHIPLSSSLRSALASHIATTPLQPHQPACQSIPKNPTRQMRSGRPSSSSQRRYHTRLDIPVSTPLFQKGAQSDETDEDYEYRYVHRRQAERYSAVRWPWVRDPSSRSRHVILPKQLLRFCPPGVCSEETWRALGIRQSPG